MSQSLSIQSPLGVSLSMILIFLSLRHLAQVRRGIKLTEPRSMNFVLFRRPVTEESDIIANALFASAQVVLCAFCYAIDN